ncbi:MAG: glycerol-3-phosphate dehydrogenase/oxidase [bacterium]
MKRDLDKLSSQEYDVLVVGAGAYGACAAWDATLRGLRVALIDKGDFGAATSQNSQKIIHGGLRYLQQFDIARMRESIRERRTLMKIAPQFVHPMPCVMPTYGHLAKSRMALAIALLLNDIIGFDRNRLDDPEKYLPRGRTVSREELLGMLPGVPREGLTGGAVWYDCQTHNSERLVLSFILSACERGADAANYLEAAEFLTEGRRVCGVRARDAVTGKTVDIRSRLVINTAGPWIDRVLGKLPTRTSSRPLMLAASTILVTRRFIGDHAAGLSSGAVSDGEKSLGGKNTRLYFVTPWRDVCLAGTAYAPYNGDPDDYRVSESDIDSFLSEINRAYPDARLGRGDVKFFYGGLVPMSRVSARTGEVIVRKHYRITDHSRTDGWDGVVTVMGVKYTTARDVAERVTNLAMKKLGTAFVRSRSSEAPIYGGEIERFDDFLAKAVRSKPAGVTEESMAHLVYHYGSRYGDVLAYVGKDAALGRPLPGQQRVIGAEVVRAAREETALKLSDVIFRRTELGTAGNPGDDCLHACAEIMGAELGWSGERKSREIKETLACYVPGHYSP